MLLLGKKKKGTNSTGPSKADFRSCTDMQLRAEIWVVAVAVGQVLCLRGSLYWGLTRIWIHCCPLYYLEFRNSYFEKSFHF